MPDKITQCKSAAFAPTRVGRTIALVLEVCIFINLKRQFKKFHFILFQIYHVPSSDPDSAIDRYLKQKASNAKEKDIAKVCK